MISRRWRTHKLLDWQKTADKGYCTCSFCVTKAGPKGKVVTLATWARPHERHIASTRTSAFGEPPVITPTAAVAPLSNVNQHFAGSPPQPSLVVACTGETLSNTAQPDTMRTYDESAVCDSQRDGMSEVQVDDMGNDQEEDRDDEGVLIVFGGVDNWKHIIRVDETKLIDNMIRFPYAVDASLSIPLQSARSPMDFPDVYLERTLYGIILAAKSAFTIPIRALNFMLQSLWLLVAYAYALGFRQAGLRETDTQEQTWQVKPTSGYGELKATLGDSELLRRNKMMPAFTANTAANRLGSSTGVIVHPVCKIVSMSFITFATRPLFTTLATLAPLANSPSLRVITRPFSRSLDSPF